MHSEPQIADREATAMGWSRERIERLPQDDHLDYQRIDLPHGLSSVMLCWKVLPAQEPLMNSMVTIFSPCG
jgi:hypothetical protein